MKRMVKYGMALAVGAAMTLGVQNARAGNIGVDVILSEGDPTGLLADVNMVLSGSQLTITLQNVSLPGSAGSSYGLLSGLAFTMPGNTRIVSGSAAVAPGSSVVNWTPVTDVSGEWGFANAVSGHFLDAGLSVDTQISTMVADTTTKFSSTPVSPPPPLDGPEWGLVRDGGNAGGLEAIMDTVIITLQLSGSPNGNFINSVNGGIVAVTFGSPEGQNGVPDGGSTLMLLGLALAALGRFAWRK